MCRCARYLANNLCCNFCRGLFRPVACERHRIECLPGSQTTRHRTRSKAWATKQFVLSADHSWRTITPLTRAAVSPVHEDLFFIGDAARVVEPFTGEGIYYAMRSGELAANAMVKIIRGEDRPSTRREFARAFAEMYRGRLWINRLARAAVLAPRAGSLFVHAARLNPVLLKFLTAKIVHSFHDE